VARALANLAASAQNHAPFMAEGAFVLCMDLLVSSSVDVQRQAIRALANLSLTEELSIQERIVDEGMPELLVLLAASWDEGVQLEAAIAIAGFAGQPRNRTALVRAGALPPLVEQLTSADAAVRYHAAIAMGALS
jgi:vacuolar protein 8